MRTSSLMRKLFARLTLSSWFQKLRTLGLYLVEFPNTAGGLHRELGSGLQERIDGGIELVPFDRSAPVIVAVDDRAILAIEQSR